MGSADGAPRITVYASLPKPGPGEEMVDRLTQLGACAIVPISSTRSGPHARELSRARRERFERVAREALKQSGRLWMPEIGNVLEFDALLAAIEPSTCAVLDPAGETALVDWAERTIGARSWSVIVGPEGGFTPEESASLAARGATACRLARYVLRIETAAEAAVAILAAHDSAR